MRCRSSGLQRFTQRPGDAPDVARGVEQTFHFLASGETELPGQVRLLEQSGHALRKGFRVFGGAGYTEDYDIARLYRDARILPIYEGTTQMQIVALVTGLGAGLKPGGVFRKYLEELLEGPEEEPLAEIPAPSEPPSVL